MLLVYLISLLSYTISHQSQYTTKGIAEDVDVTITPAPVFRTLGGVRKLTSGKIADDDSETSMMKNLMDLFSQIDVSFTF